jgi:hypothetical protein
MACRSGLKPLPPSFLVGMGLKRDKTGLKAMP